MIEAIKEYQLTWNKQLAVVRDITLAGETVRRLRERVRGHLPNSAQWEEVYAAVYLDPARLFPLALTGEPKKPFGMGDEQFIRMVLGGWEEVDYSQINWTEPAPLVAGNRKPYD